MSTTRAALQYSRSAGRQQRLALDPVILVTVFALLLVGLVMVSSASLNVAEGLTGDPYYHFERQSFGTSLRSRAMLSVPIHLKRFAPWLLSELRAAVLVVSPHRARGQWGVALDPHRSR